MKLKLSIRKIIWVSSIISSVVLAFQSNNQQTNQIALDIFLKNASTLDHQQRNLEIKEEFRKSFIKHLDQEPKIFSEHLQIAWTKTLDQTKIKESIKPLIWKIFDMLFQATILCVIYWLSSKIMWVLVQKLED